MREPFAPEEALKLSAPSGLLDLSRQQRNMLLLRPVFALERSKSLGDDGDIFEGLDTHYLVLATLDHLMEATHLSMGSTSTEVLTFLAQTVSQMKPAVSQEQALRAANAVLDALDNKANKHREFEADYFDAASRQMKTFRFRLVRFEPDPQDVYRYAPTSEGVLVYMGMLDLKPEDTQELMAKMLDLMVQRGRFDQALDIARRARAASISFRNEIQNKLYQAYRAPATVNWSQQMAGRLDEARNHVLQRQSEDVRMEQAVRDSLDEAEEPRSRQNLAQLLELLRSAGLIRMKLVGDINASPEQFIEAQKTVFRARKPTGLPDLETSLLPTLLQLPSQELGDAADSFITALYPPDWPKVFDLNTTLALLVERRSDEAVQPDEEGEIEAFEPMAEQFPKALVDQGRQWLGNQFAQGRAWQVDALLQQAQAEGFDPEMCRCLVFLLYQSFAESENSFKGLASKRTGESFQLEFVRGDNIEFFRKDGP